MCVHCVARNLSRDPNVHNSCLCGAQFCYNCGERWKNCACEQWNEHRLLARAYQIVDREVQPEIDDPRPEIDDRRPGIDNSRPEIEISQLGTGKLQPVTHDPLPDEESRATAQSPVSVHDFAQTPRDILVSRTIQELRENHECGHNRWKYVHGPHVCEECLHHLGKYIFECRRCRLQACNRCRRNRL